MKSMWNKLCKWFGINVMRVPEVLAFVTHVPVDLITVAVDFDIEKQESRVKFDVAMQGAVMQAMSHVANASTKHTMLKEHLDKRDGWNRSYTLQLVVAVPRAKEKKGAG